MRSLTEKFSASATRTIGLRCARTTGLAGHSEGPPSSVYADAKLERRLKKHLTSTASFLPRPPALRGEFVVMSTGKPKGW